MVQHSSAVGSYTNGVQQQQHDLSPLLQPYGPSSQQHKGYAVGQQHYYQPSLQQQQGDEALPPDFHIYPGQLGEKSSSLPSRRQNGGVRRAHNQVSAMQD
jgi:hypothetical protein